MNATSNCPRCGAELATGTPAGICPRCAAEVLQATQTEVSGQSASPALPFIPPTVGELAPLFPQLDILELVGQGGMGVVYKARQKELDRLVALKILPPLISQAATFAERFTREAKALAKLNHPGIVTIYDFGRADSLYYFLMEFVDGVNLRQLLQAGRIAPREALAIVPQICDALQYAHDHGIVHRDIKPENILLDRQGRVKVADFGLAKLADTGSNPPTASGGASLGPGLTEATILGTPQYMAPEQKERPAEVDHRADIYALGVVFYQMLTGELPGQCLEPPSRKVQIDVRLDEIVLRALEQQPELRFQQVSEIKTSVETIVSGAPAKTEVSLNASSGAPSAGGAPPTDPPPVSFHPKSRAALFGALWVVQFFLNWILSYTPPGWAITAALRRSPLSTVGELLFELPMLLLGWAAPVGATALGLVALRQIRQSGRRLRGVGLAVFDFLFFPLLLLNGWLVWLGWQVVSESGLASAATENRLKLPALVVLGLLWLLLNGFLIRAIQRKALQFVNKPPAPTPPPVTGTWAEAFRKAGWRVLLVILADLALFETLAQVSLHWKESTGELYEMGLMVATLAAFVWACWPGMRLKASLLFVAGGTIFSAFLLLVVANLYSCDLRPNLGLRREADWVTRIPGFQRQQRLRIAQHLWRRPRVAHAFGPIIQRLLPVDDLNRGQLLDLDNGQQLTRRRFDPSASETLHWVRTQQFDLAVVWQEERTKALGLNLIAAPVSLSDWEQDTPQNVADFFQLEWRRPKELTALWPLVDHWQVERHLPQEALAQWPSTNTTGTFYFRTRSGAMGLLQLSETNLPSKALQIRYKLVSTK